MFIKILRKKYTEVYWFNYTRHDCVLLQCYTPYIWAAYLWAPWKEFNPHNFTHAYFAFPKTNFIERGFFTVYIEDYKLLFVKDHPMFTHQDTYFTLTQLGAIFSAL